jgi:hypothetical protein
MKSLKNPKTRDSRVADSIAQAEAMSGYDRVVLLWAKKNGCSAFRGSRVYIDELAPWLETNKPEVREGELPTKEEVDVLLKLEKLETQKFLNSKNRDAFYERKDVDSWMIAAAEKLKSLLALKLKNELPPKLVGLQPDEISAKMDPIILEICKIFRAPVEKVK